ncbi:alpha-ketoglutarate dependent xanthine dioxygenase-1 [Venturia nashicola]|uniref:Alpha-ketoglutarate dependent xanthine dioxygenase-1 n=1 Tax=Venturia nashicola TaxID=86259 RepID=A0A4Z1PBV1_9PEZI|nr:alpha-ketoglutarate dependent xanthine dioxygenase-1 [Venturia nashicola]
MLLEDRIRIVPLSDDLRKSSRLGAEVLLPGASTSFDLKSLSREDKAILRQAFYDQGILLIRNQHDLNPDVLYDVAELIDPHPTHFHSGGKRQVTDPKNILALNGCNRLPRAPQVTVIGKGHYEGYEGIPELDLKHLDHLSFHENPLSESQIAEGLTRPYRWHMDAPLYENLPGFVTSIRAIEVPKIPRQKLQFPDDTNMDLAAGSTLFFSGARNFELLSPEEQEFAINTTVQYAPRAYEWMRNCKATADGLSIEKAGRETPLDQLPDFEWDKVQSFPMVWQNHGNNEPHLQILGCCVYALTTTDPKTGQKTTITDIQEVRRICHGLQSKVYRPENVYAHDWKEGDLVLFHNRGVMHSISGQLETWPEKRLLWQCNMASGAVPKAYGRGEC